MTKIVLALIILGCSNLDWANLQEPGTGGAAQSSGSGSTQENSPKQKKEPGGGGGVDTWAMLGTWKLNEAKSKFAPGAPKNNTVVYSVVGAKIKVMADGVDGTGKPTYIEWSGTLDGKEYPVTGDPSSDKWSYKEIDDHTVEVSVTKDGKVTISGRIVVSADGKSRIVRISGTDPMGKKVKTTAVYDKQ